MEFVSGKFPRHSRMEYPLHPRNVLHVALLKSWHGTRQGIKIYPFCVGTDRMHMRLYFTVITIDTIVVIGSNIMRNIMLSVFRLL